MERQWFIISGGRQVGPMRAEELKNHGLSADSMVWTAGMPDWRPARDCADLAHVLSGNCMTGGCVEVESDPAAACSQNIDVEAPAGAPTYGAGASQQYGGAAYGEGGGRRVPDPDNPGNWTTAGSAGARNYGQPYGEGYGQGYSPGTWSGKSKIVAGLLAIFLGYVGAHYFYCGKIGGGFIALLLSLVTCGLWSVITLIQGIYMLTLTDRQFDEKYVYNPSSFPIF